jgi:glucose-1-phosphate adenylyltransferase
MPLTQQIPVLVLAGGHGKRLFPLTLSQPKPALPFVSCRLIDFTLANCVLSGFENCTILTQYRHEQIAAHISSAWHDAFACRPPGSGQQYCGTADAVFQNLSCFADAEHVLILGGDHVYEMDYRHLVGAHIESNADLTLGTVESSLSKARSFGVIEIDDDFRVRGFVEKPSTPKPMPHRPEVALVSMGIYVFRVQTLMEALRRSSANGSGFDFGYQIIPSLIETGRVFGHNFCDQNSGRACYWRDVGGLDSYYAASMDFLGPNPPFNPLVIRPSISKISGGGRISHTALCGDVRIEGNVEIEDSILMPRVRVGAGVRLRRTIVDEGVHLPENFTAGWDVEADSQHHIVSPGEVVVISHTPRGYVQERGKPARGHTQRNRHSRGNLSQPDKSR